MSNGWASTEPRYMSFEVPTFMSLAAIAMLWHLLLNTEMVQEWVQSLMSSDVLDAYALVAAAGDEGVSTEDISVHLKGRIKHQKMTASRLMTQMTILACLSFTTWLLDQMGVFSAIESETQGTSQSQQCIDDDIPYDQCPSTDMLHLVLDVQMQIFCAMLLWFFSMLCTIEGCMSHQLVLKGYFLHRRHNQSIPSDVRKDTILQDTESLEYDTLRDYFIRTSHLEVPEVQRNFDFSRYLCLCLDDALMVLTDFSISSWIVAIVFQAFVGIWVCWVIETSMPEIWRQSIFLCIMPCSTLGLTIWANSKIDVALKLGLEISLASHRNPEDDEHDYGIKDEAETTGFFTTKYAMLLMQSTTFSNAYMVARVIGAKRLYNGTWGGTSPIETIEAVGIVLIHLTAGIVTILIQIKCIIRVTIAASMPPFFDDDDQYRAQLVGELETHSYYTNGDGAMPKPSQKVGTGESVALADIRRFESGAAGLEMEVNPVSSPSTVKKRSNASPEPTASGRKAARELVEKAMKKKGGQVEAVETAVGRATAANNGNMVMSVI